jgi:alpha-1,6-mannosyltransferase
VKVLDITDFYSERGGGIRSHLSAKGTHLARLGVEHVVIAPGPEDEETCLPAEEGSSLGARVLRVRGWAQPYDHSYYFLNRVGRARELIMRERPDVLELNSPYLAAVAALSLGRRRGGVLTWCWHSDHIDTHLSPRLESRFGQAPAGALTRPLWSILRAVGDRARAILVASRWQRDKLGRYGFRRVFELPFGVNKQAFGPHARSAERRRQLLGAGAPEATLLVAVGRLSVEKRWDVVLDAFFRVRQRRQAVLVFFGDGPERTRIAAQVGDRHDVRLLGFEPDPGRLGSALASADLLVHGCPYETFGLGVAQAVSAGLPIVVPDRGGASEHARGASAESYAVGSGPACAAAIERLLGREQSAVRAAALEAAEHVLSVERQYAATVELYRGLLAPGGLEEEGTCSV